MARGLVSPIILARIGLLLLLLLLTSANVSIFVTVALIFIFVADDSLGLPLPRTQNQRHITAIIRALFTLRKPAQQTLKVHAHAQPSSSRKFQCSTHMMRAHDPVPKTPNPRVPTQSKVQFAPRDCAEHNAPCELDDERV
jgi:hypothetical protein